MALASEILAAEAACVFREGNRPGPRNGRMLFGLMESPKSQGKQDPAESVRREFEAAGPRRKLGSD
jgi:hypothetical protein